MALPASGIIDFAAIRTELGDSSSISLNDSNVRGLAGKASGAISFSDLFGKTNAISDTYSTGEYKNAFYSAISGSSSVAGAAYAAGSYDVTYIDVTFNKLNSFTMHSRFNSQTYDGYSAIIYLKAYNASTSALIASATFTDSGSNPVASLTKSGLGGINVRFVFVIRHGIYCASYSGSRYTAQYGWTYENWIQKNYNQY